MNNDEKKILKHDFLNSIAIINSTTKSVLTLLNKIEEQSSNTQLNKNQINRYSTALQAILIQTTKIESYFEQILNIN
ncbi:hypothetical protein [Legionella jamestowniensis]|uniref:hypothetical protein n=1 Tax=Legionella jamestowniensis TaxID=455 RepID=UPI0008EB43EC|nr:hypothetical protein [Legionella jamestowniensis]SFM08433.1 hypothetical protein SAMN02746073_0341 [Legionella jamestowniensis DSM 19215]